MTDDDVVSLAVRTVRAISGAERVIRAFPGNDEPGDPYLVVNFLGTAKVREHEADFEFEEADDDVTATPVVETEWRFSLHACGAGGSDWLRRIDAGSQLLQTQEIMHPLLIHDTSAVRSLPEFINNAWQPRSQMDLNIRGLTRDGFVILTAEQAHFTVNGLPIGPISQ